MEFFAESLQGPLIAQWSIVLLHFIWQGFVIAGMVSIALRVFTWAQPNVRYGISLCGLLAVIVVVATTFRMTALGRTEAQNIAAQDVEQPLPSVGGAQFHSSESAMTIEMLYEPEPWRLSELAEHWRVAVVFAWFCGQLAMALRMIVGWTLLQRLKLRSLEISTELQSLSERLAKRIGLRVAPTVRSSMDLTDAAAFGFLRSVVLLPAPWLTEMTPEMVEAVLAHEFSHVRRHDVWVNLVQRLVESTFFYHPAVWWMSKQIRVERERCRDAEAIRATGRREVFAKTLEYAARQRAGSRIALASNLGDDRMSLLDRINRVLNGRPTRQHTSGWQFGIAALFVPAILAWNFPSQSTVAQESSVQPTQGYDASPADAEPPTIAGPPLGASEAGVDVALALLDGPTQKIPSERSKVTLPKYRIGPPDVLLIEVVSAVPKAPLKINSSDFLQVIVPNALADEPIAGPFQVNRNGMVTFGKSYGWIKLSGLTLDEAQAAIGKSLTRLVDKPDVSVSLLQAAGMENVFGEHRVSPDGYVNLGIFGSVFVAGMTADEACASLERQMETRFDEPKLSVQVLSPTSSWCYIITKGPESADHIVRIPVTGNETVLDAISQVGGLKQQQQRSMWIARPGANGAPDQILPIDWEQITRGANSASNYQVFPGDRIFVSDEPIPHGRIKDESSIESAVGKFNRFVDQQDYYDAIVVAKRLKKSHPKNVIAVALANHAELLKEHMRLEDGKRTEGSFDEIRSSTSDRNNLSKALRKRIDVKMVDVQFQDAVRIVAKTMGANIVVDREGLMQSVVANDETVTLELKNVLAKNAISLIIDPFGLEYVERDGVIFITSPELTVRYTPIAYNVKDLLSIPTVDVENGKVRSVTLEDVIKLIKDTVASDEWDEFGGRSSIQGFTNNSSLVVTATEQTHKSIEGLLRQLRSLNRERLR